MATAKKLLIGLSIAAGIGAAWYFIREVLNKFSFKVVSYGVPSFNDMILRVPVTIQFNNPTGVTIDADQVMVDAYIKNNAGQLIHTGRVVNPITIPPGVSSHTVIPVVDLQSLVSSVASSIGDLINRKPITLQTNLTIIDHGIQFPVQEFTDEIKL